ncbi:major facilitator superfamily domain-containing protein [Leucosporidium creatinivorum]|uniref:Major facilitator superfamily domain-containing protein n=1 Tax=Leucosporidium creatinivorum TaxID=106004 RepID=A0A1Y2FVR3_9BASI|nr:major facilitator superfamily domain-containing protein [Leucosporidium creatinivorum]
MSNSTSSNEKQLRPLEDEHVEEKIAAATSAAGRFGVNEKHLLRKIDFKLVPFLSLLYLLSFLDRVNIGQAKLDGLEDDLNLVGNQYNIALVVFFVGYVITEVPSNILLKKLRPTRFIPMIMVSWGIVMTLMGIVHNFAGLTAARFVLGLTESGLFPGICFYLTMWYRRREANLRISIFFSSATLAGAFGGLLAYGISQMDGLGGRAGWAWIFIIEGLLTLVVGLAAPFLMADFPEESKFLTPDEKAAVIARLKEDQGAAGEAKFSKVHFFNAVKDWRVYCYMLIYIGVAEPLYSLALFVPTIIANLGTFTRPQAMLLSTPPYFLAFFVTLASALYSDRIGHRGYFNVFWMSVAALGYIILLAVDPRKHPAPAYFAVFLAVTGVAPCISGTITWCGNNIGPTLKRATGMGMMFTLGNSGGIVSSLVYFKQDSPRFQRGHAVGLGFACMAILLSLFLTFNLKRENARRDALYGTATLGQDDIVSGKMTQEQLQRWGLEGMSEDEITALGDRHPAFRYIC